MTAVFLLGDHSFSVKVSGKEPSFEFTQGGHSIKVSRSHSFEFSSSQKTTDSSFVKKTATSSSTKKVETSNSPEKDTASISIEINRRRTIKFSSGKEVTTSNALLPKEVMDSDSDSNSL